MMTPDVFLAVFDPERWLTGADVIARLDMADYWQGRWREASIAEKAEYVQGVCEEWYQEDERLPVIMAIQRREGETQCSYYKPSAHLTLEDMMEAREYFYRTARESQQMVQQCDALRMEHDTRQAMRQLTDRAADV